MRGVGASGDRGPRVLILGSGVDALAEIDADPLPALALRISAGCPVTVSGGSLPFPVRRVLPAYGLRPLRLRTMMAAARAWGTARRAGVPHRWLWAVKSDPELRRTFRKVDVVVSTDAPTDRVLNQLPELLAGCTVVRSGDRAVVWRALRALTDVLGALEAQCSTRIVDGRITRRPLDPETLSDLQRMVDPALARAVPPALLPVDLMADTARRLATALGPEVGAPILLDVLGHFAWERAPEAGRSGLSAQWAAARIWLARDEADFPAEHQLADAAGAALTGADDALDAGAWDLARGRLVDAMTLLFHRERHADVLRSSLVVEPAAYLGPLYANRTFQRVVAGGRRPALRRAAAAPSDERPTVLVLGGAYGQFHGPVVEALSEVATVTLRRPRRLNRFFSRKAMDPQAIDALAALRGLGPSGDADPWAVEALNQEVLRALAPRLRRADVVFTDWADRLTVWASHLVPSGCRLVVRIHSLDALHPWFHLVDWTAVDQIIVVSEPLRRLVQQMLGVAGAQVPVTVVPNIAALHEVDQPKDPGARTTLGMVGWGRRVKDPLWALDLLERDPSWRLLLIGPDLPGRSASAKAYHERVASRLLDPAIRDRVEIVGWTDDVARHLRRVGVILSTSRRESWHLGLVEGAASGAVPVVRNWPLYAPLGGARSLFPQEWVVETLDEAEERVRTVTDPERWEDARRRARAAALTLFDPERVAQDYRDVILGPLPRGSAPGDPGPLRDPARPGGTPRPFPGSPGTQGVVPP